MGAELVFVMPNYGIEETVKENTGNVCNTVVLGAKHSDWVR